MSRPAIITTPELNRYAKVAKETGLPVTIEVAGRRITIGGTLETSSEKDKAKPEIDLDL